MSIISNIHGRQVLDSRGNPTVEAVVTLENGVQASAIVPSGASTGKHEAVELRDNIEQVYMGKSVLTAVQHVRFDIAKALVGMRADDQQAIDAALINLDGTPNKGRLGANAMLAVSTAVAQAAAKSEGLPLFKYINASATLLPYPLMNILNGGAHADNPIDFQEYMIVPLRADTFSESLQMGVRIFHTLKNVLSRRGYSTNVGDEGGFAPNIASNDEAIEMVLLAIEKAGYTPGEDVKIAIDAACSELYDTNKKRYVFKKSSGAEWTSEEMVNYWETWVEKYPIVSIEDGMDEDDWAGWKLLTERIGDKIQLVGDDLFVTNVKRLQQGIDSKTANSILVKINQIGTISETIDAVAMAHKNGYNSVMSHRSGETEDTTIADLAVALECGQIKTGSASRTDRIAKYNQLLRIEELLGSAATFGTKPICASV